MYTILRASTNLTDICVSLNLKEEDSTEGACRGLPLINPVRLILAYQPMQFFIQGTTRELVDTIVTCIPSWENLAVVEMPHDSPDSVVAHNGMVAVPLKAAKNLRSLVLSSYEEHLFVHGRIQSETPIRTTHERLCNIMRLKAAAAV
ncbi:hypothetical protein FB45DRAFT_125588 [Roridomyces roridus]|uniref:Uncharacterized protein n=1 Tax=Roridomyces roridus TaxID=1738132 RepID=A0AAD7FJK3_9AGAR|nr:hypothetical protein FB45DRAFT_125588 [Roridomyces roridus]